MFGEVVDRGAADGLGMTMRLREGLLRAHSFFIVVRIIDVIQHKYMRVAVSGDLEGIGDVTLIPDGAGCQWHLDWRMSITRGWMRPLGKNLPPAHAVEPQVGDEPGCTAGGRRGSPSTRRRRGRIVEQRATFRTT